MSKEFLLSAINISLEKDVVRNHSYSCVCSGRLQGKSLKARSNTVDKEVGVIAMDKKVDQMYQLTRIAM